MCAHQDNVVYPVVSCSFPAKTSVISGSRKRSEPVLVRYKLFLCFLERTTNALFVALFIEPYWKHTDPLSCTWAKLWHMSCFWRSTVNRCMWEGSGALKELGETVTTLWSLWDSWGACVLDLLWHRYWPESWSRNICILERRVESRQR